MTDVVTIATAVHVAVLDPMTGLGLLVCPDPALDVSDPFELSVEEETFEGDMPLSLHEADLQQMLSRLAEHSWEPTETDPWGGVLIDTVLPNGRMLVGLYGLDPVTSNASMEELAGAHASLLTTLRGI